MEQLPTEINYLILLNLPYELIINLCLTNKQYNEICIDNYFWYSKYKSDFNKYLNETLIISNEIDWKQNYKNKYLQIDSYTMPEILIIEAIVQKNYIKLTQKFII